MAQRGACIFNDFSTASHSATSLRAFGVRSLCSFFAARQRMNQESAPKGLMPFGFPQRANIATLSLRSYLREILHFQLLRLQVKETCKHGSSTQIAKQKFMLSATPPVQLIFKQKRFRSPCLPRVVAMRREMHKGIYVFLLMIFVDRHEIK